MTARPFLATVMWSPGIKRGGDDWPVTVTFEAGGYQPYVEATWEQPAEGGMFEDVFFKSAEIEGGEPLELTPDEMAAAKAWFESGDASDPIQQAAHDQAPGSDPDPDNARDEAWERMLEQDSFDDEVAF